MDEQENRAELRRVFSGKLGRSVALFSMLAVCCREVILNAFTLSTVHTKVTHDAFFKQNEGFATSRPMILAMFFLTWSSHI